MTEDDPKARVMDNLSEFVENGMADRLFWEATEDP